jgi:H+/Cl- antiporter ClcA
MAIRLFINNLIETTYSPLQRPREESDVVSNTFKFSTWICQGAGAISLLSAIFSKYAMHGTAKAMIPYVINASFGSTLASASIAVYTGYKLDFPDQNKDFFYILNQEALSLEWRITLISYFGTIATLAARILFKANPTINWMADRSIQPLVWMCITGFVILIFNTLIFSSYQKTQTKRGPL